MLAFTASEVIQNSLLTVYSDAIGFLPKLIIALIVLIVGWLVAVLLGKAAYHIIRLIQLNKALEMLGFKAIEKGGLKLDAPRFFEGLIKWFFIIVFFLAAANIVGLYQVADFLNTVVLYVPNVVAAAVVLVIGVLIARFVEHAVRASVKTAKLASANAIALIARWSILVFAILIALDQLGIGSEIIRILVIGIIAMIAIAGGLAFGLGSQKHAESLISKLKDKMQD